MRQIIRIDIPLAEEFDQHPEWVAQVLSRGMFEWVQRAMTAGSVEWDTIQIVRSPGPTGSVLYIIAGEIES